MHTNIILAGVGGQGILTIAQVLARTAMHLGCHVKQSEVHGMSQRGGAVQAHLRISAQPIYSALIPHGEADVVLALDPLEALRYVPYLKRSGVIVASATPFVNIPNYPSLEDVLDRIVTHADHILINTGSIAKAIGSPRCENMVLLGATSLVLDLPTRELEKQITGTFATKSERVIDMNRRAFHTGVAAGRTYRDGLSRGMPSRTLRRWMQEVDLAALESGTSDLLPQAGWSPLDEQLSAGERLAVARKLLDIQEEGRRQLFEHEVYGIVELVGAIHPPHYVYLHHGHHVTEDDLTRFPSDHVVLKVVSTDVVHKSDAGGVIFVPCNTSAINREIDELLERQRKAGARVSGVLVVEYLEQAGRGLGSELFVGIRATREFGPVIAAGLGGIDTEYLALRMQRGAAVAKAMVLDHTPETFFESFRRTAAYELLAGKARGHERVVSDGDLIRCFRAFMGIARAFCVAGGEEPTLKELEVNPFAFAEGRLIPLDGRGRLGPVVAAPPARPVEQVDRLLMPQSIAVMGVSSKNMNFGRIILNNIRASGFADDHLYVIKKGVDAVDGIPCVPSVAELPGEVDLLVAAISGDQVPALVDELTDPDSPGFGRCGSVILIPGGLGEKSGTEFMQTGLAQKIQTRRRAVRGVPVFLGGNCMGVRSRAGHYDTFFIPDAKLDPRRQAPSKRAAFISQSGAFMITRISNLEFLDPTFAVSVGNQLDLTLADMVEAVGRRDDIDTIGVYVEGLNDGDGVDLVRAIKRVTAIGKVVVFYKAGRTRAGRKAAQGHTASVAGDYDVCMTAVADAGAVVTETFKEFEQILELSTDLYGLPVRGVRLGAVGNAGFEAVGIADNLRGSRYRIELARLGATTGAELHDILADGGLARLIDVRNPLDLTPMADDETYERAVRALLQAPEVDAVLVACVPMTPRLLTTPEEIQRSESIVHRLRRVFREARKPMVVVVDSAAPYDEMARAIRVSGIPVFVSADQATRSLGRYLSHSARSRLGGAAACAAGIQEGHSLKNLHERESRSPDDVPKTGEHVVGAP